MMTILRITIMSYLRRLGYIASAPFMLRCICAVCATLHLRRLCHIASAPCVLHCISAVCLRIVTSRAVLFKLETFEPCHAASSCCEPRHTELWYSCMKFGFALRVPPHVRFTQFDDDGQPYPYWNHLPQCVIFFFEFVA
jgi:hypothetical protein